MFDDWFATVAATHSELPDFASNEWNKMFGESKFQYVTDDSEEDEINNDDLQDAIQTNRQAEKINAYQEFHNPTKPLEVDEPLSSSSLSHSQSPIKSSETTIERTTQA